LREVLATSQLKSLSYYETIHRAADFKITLRRLRWAEHVAFMGDGRGAYGVLVRSPEGKRPLGKTRLR